MFKGTGKTEKAQASAVLAEQCWLFLRPFLSQLNQHLDRRLVKTLLDLVQVILIHRHRNNGLVLSELGDQLLGGEHGPAGVKRIGRLIHSHKWTGHLILQFLWRQGQAKIHTLRQQQESAYVIWDESVLEKPESLKAEGLCAVRSTKAERLKRIKPGYFNPPTERPIFVPGLNWLQLLVTGLKGTPVLTHLCWWTTRGWRASRKREEEGAILRKVAKLWGRAVIHLWDRGFAGSPWATQALERNLRFILRWNKSYHLLGPDGRKQEVWKISRGKRSWDYRLLWDARRRCWRKTGVIALPVRLPQDERLLYLVVSRPGYGRKPWYLITTEPIHTAEQAWRIILAYARRWQIEMSLRFSKTELAFESPRLIAWGSRLKLLLIATLAYAFLLSLLTLPDLIHRTLDAACHRTGKWSQEVLTPLYRLRLALSRLWLDCRPQSLPKLNSG